jgi:hypothetical protein
MRGGWMLLVCLAPGAARAAGLELELSPGIAVSQDSSAAAPVVRGRIGVGFPYLTPSLVVFGTLSGDPGPSAHQNQGGGIDAWGVATEVRVHNSGSNQFGLALGAGVGQLTVTQQSGGDLASFRGHVAPYVEAAVGYRHQGDRIRFGLDATLDVFNRVDFVSDVNPGPHGSSWLLGLAITVGWRFGSTHSAM